MTGETESPTKGLIESAKQDETKAWKLIEKMVAGAHDEQKKSRRWTNLFRFGMLAYLFYVASLFAPSDDMAMPAIGPHTAMVEVNGVISAQTDANADTIVSGLRAAFKDSDSKAILIRINSPGGSPVQSGYVFDEIRRLKEQYQNKPVYAVIQDLGASGAYYIAAAADYVYADKASLVGSIGVVGSGFGFVDAMERVGVERRVFTSGENKGFLDPFSPLKQEEQQFWTGVLETTHQQFIDAVKAGRGDRLADDPKLYSGLIWPGEEALDLGLIDGLGSAGYVARELVGHSEIVDYTIRPTAFEELFGRMGTKIGEGLAFAMGLNGPKLQ